MMDRPLVSILIPVFNNWSLTQNCLLSLCEHMPTDLSFEVILVDNNSTDETARDAQPFGQSLLGERFRLFRQEENLGFARAINLGASEARGEYLYLLNNDTIIISDPVSTPMALLEKHSDLGATGPLLIFPDSGRIQHLGITIAHGTKCSHLYFLFPPSHPVTKRERRFQAITMAAFCVRRELFMRLGGLFEGYVNGMEDVDFCVRMSQEGLACAIAPETIVHHIAGQSVGRFDQDVKNSRLLGSRCSKLLTPDMNVHAEADGYQMRLNPWLDPYLVLGQQRQQEMDAAWQACSDPEALPEMLFQEPCWEHGWDILQDHFQRLGDPHGELFTLVQKSAFYPTPQTFTGILNAAKQAGDFARVNSMIEQKIRSDAILEHPTAMRAQAKSAMYRAQSVGNDELVKIMASWIAENSQQDIANQ